MNQDALGILNGYYPLVEPEMQALLSGQSGLLYSMMRYHLGWEDASGQPVEGGGGKGVRATLCLLACRATGGDLSQALPAAAAVELIHNFSLIHDDIQDASPQRRHRPAVWRVWGSAQAINAGDGMHSLAHLALAKLEGKGVAAATVVAAGRLLAQACLELCHGQTLDLAYQERLDIGVEAYLEMIGKKTAALFEVSTGLGALLGHQAQVDPFRRLGRKLGLAFQIRDDLLGIWGEASVTGKETGDLMAKKETLPVVWALERAAHPTRDELMAIYSGGEITPQAEARIRELLAAAGLPGPAAAMARHFLNDALAELVGLSGEAAQELRTLARFLVEREF